MSQQALFENQQWRVTETSLESIDPRSEYVVPLSEIFRVRDTGRQRLYEWPVQMSEKSWVDVEAFIAAFLFAIRDLPFDRTLLEASLSKARNLG